MVSVSTHYSTKDFADFVTGDPLNGQAVGSVPSSEVLEICASGDQICNGSGTLTITQAHLTYGDNAAQAATFIEGQTGV